MSDLTVILVAYAAIGGGLCSFVAGEKNRDKTGWFLTGAVTGILGLIAIAGLPPIDLEEEEEEIEAVEEKLTEAE